MMLLYILGLVFVNPSFALTAQALRYKIEHGAGPIFNEPSRSKNYDTMYKFIQSVMPRPKGHIPVVFTRRTLFSDAAHANDYSHTQTVFPDDGFGAFDFAPPKHVSYPHEPPKRFPSVYKCTDGDVVRIDKCNRCICVAGQLYICTFVSSCYSEAKETGRTENLLSIKTSQGCQSSDTIPALEECQSCQCIDDKVMCTRSLCKENGEPNPLKCSGMSLPHSGDSCNSCTCLEGLVYCTTKICITGINDNSTLEEKSRLKYVIEYNAETETIHEGGSENTTTETSMSDDGCTPGDWYALPKKSNTGFCRECFCLNGELSFCFMRMCKDLGQCKRGDKYSLGSDKTCHTCECGDKGSWRCVTLDGVCKYYHSDPLCEDGNTARGGAAGCGACYCAKGNNVCSMDDACANKLEFVT